jgi:hypothetical protein
MSEISLNSLSHTHSLYSHPAKKTLFPLSVREKGINHPAKNKNIQAFDFSFSKRRHWLAKLYFLLANQRSNFISNSHTSN